MGSRLVLRVLAVCAAEKGLGAVPRLTLVCMAMHALDGAGRNTADPPWTYWGGHPPLAREVFGVHIKPTTGTRAITRAIRELESHQLLRILEPNPGGRIPYLLLPDDPDNPARGGDT